MYSHGSWDSAEQAVVDLFIAEIPEVAGGLIELRALARTAGLRTKVAVASRDAKQNAVKTFVGVDEVHMRRLSQLLPGEIVDVVPWRDDFAQRVRMAVAPANIARMELDEGQQVAQVELADNDSSRRLMDDYAHRQLVNRFVAGRVELSIAASA